MRELAFRVWDGNHNKFVYPDVLELRAGIDYQQHTGLKDMNGVPIWEGDIINYEGDTHLVIWNKHVACFDVDLGIEVEPLYRLISYIEVVGNKFENSELLQQ